MNETEERSSKNDEKWKIRTIFVHILIVTFGISSWIAINGIFIQLPLLVDSLPEGWRLAAYLTVSIQTANIAPISYSLLRKFSFKINESKCIIRMLMAACCLMGMISFFYNKTFKIFGSKHSAALFLLTFFMATISCTSSVLFMPYLKNFKKIYLVSYFIGEGLSGVVPSIIALLQGTVESQSCNNSTNTNNSSVNVDSPRFSTRAYFLSIFVCLLLSLLAFLLLENLPFIKKEKICTQAHNNNPPNKQVPGCYCQKYLLMSSKGLTAECDILERHICTDNFQKTDVKKLSKTDNVSNNSKKSLENIDLFVLLGLICLLAHGLLPGLQPFSCLSYGNMTYHLSATLSHIANPIACFLGLWFLPRDRKLINCLSFVIFTASGYVAFLALSSPNPPFRGTKGGKVMVILLWILLLGLIAYTKLTITSVFRRKSEKSLFHVGLVMQAGSACGAVLSFTLINFTTLLQEYKKCIG